MKSEEEHAATSCGGSWQPKGLGLAYQRQIKAARKNPGYKAIEKEVAGSALSHLLPFFPMVQMP